MITSVSFRMSSLRDSGSKSRILAPQLMIQNLISSVPATSGENHTFILIASPWKTPKLGPMNSSKLKSPPCP